MLPPDDVLLAELTNDPKRLGYKDAAGNFKPASQIGHILGSHPAGSDVSRHAELFDNENHPQVGGEICLKQIARLTKPGDWIDGIIADGDATAEEMAEWLHMRADRLLAEKSNAERVAARNKALGEMLQAAKARAESVGR